MRYSTILFDFGDTLTSPHPDGTWRVYDWMPKMISRLYDGGYRLGIISNTHRYQDGWWVRNCLADANILHHFEVVISSATYAVHKPTLEIFHKALNMMQIKPQSALMVGDSVHCDGACQYLQMDYLQIMPREDWSGKLYEKIRDERLRTRKLCNLYDVQIHGDTIVTKVRHLSDPLVPGDIIMLKDREVQVLEVSKTVTKPEILKAKDEFISIKFKEIK